MYISKYKNYLLVIDQDEFPLNPREDYDNFGKMVCFHRRYILGDKHQFSTPRAFMSDLIIKYCENTTVNENVIWQFVLNNKATDVRVEKNVEVSNSYDFFTRFDYNHSFSEEPDKTLNVDELKEVINIEWILDQLYDNEMISLVKDIKEIIIMPLYLMDHSGISISVNDFGDPWDSGQVGWIYATKEKIIEEYGEFNDYTIAKAKHIMENEVEFYDHYLSGDVYYYTLYDMNQEDVIDSCGSYIGDFDDIIDDIINSISDDKKFNEKLKANLKPQDKLMTQATINFNYYKNMED